MSARSTNPRILFVSHDASRTGSPINLLNFLRWLRQNTDQEFELIVGRDGPLLSEFAKLAKIHTPQALAQKSEANLREFFQGFGLIYANSCWSWNSSLAENWPYGDVPIVTHLLELDCSVDALGAKTIAVMIRHSNHYIASTRVGARMLERRFRIPRERISVHYCTVEPGSILAGESADSSATLRLEYGIPEDAFVVAACGTIEARKGPDLFVQLAARLCRQFGNERPLRFLWIGHGKDADLERFLRYDVRHLGLQEQVKLVGELAVPHRLLALSNVFCVTAREEALAMAMLETALLGIPVLYFDDAGGAGEFGSFGGGSGVPYLDVEAMAAKCREFMLDPSLAEELGRCGAEAVQAHLTVDVAAPKLWREIEAFLRQPPPMSAHRAANANLAEIFETWLLDEAPDRSSILPIVARNSARRQARALMAEGRRNEAVSLLVRTARADMASNDGGRILESLVEISGDLMAIDEAKARYLRVEAEKLARLAGVKLDPMPVREPAVSG